MLRLKASCIAQSGGSISTADLLVLTNVVLTGKDKEVNRTDISPFRIKVCVPWHSARLLRRALAESAAASLSSTVLDQGLSYRNSVTANKKDHKRNKSLPNWLSQKKEVCKAKLENGFQGFAQISTIAEP